MADIMNELRGKKPYIYTNNKNPYEEGFRWYIEWFSNPEDAVKECEEGWKVELYTTTKQYLGFQYR